MIINDELKKEFDEFYTKMIQDIVSVQPISIQMRDILKPNTTFSTQNKTTEE